MNPNDEGTRAIDQDEHNAGAHAKRVVLRGFNTETGVYEDGSVSFGRLVWEQFDYISAAYPLATTEVYTYKVGGSGGATVAVVTVVYTDSTKESVSTVTKV